MGGCSSCSGCTTEPNFSPTKKADKLEKVQRSDNARYPHVFVGKQAIYTDQDVQMIVTVVSDDCDDRCDCFTLNPQQILKDLQKKHSPGNAFDVSQPVGEICWKLQALI